MEVQEFQKKLSEISALAGKNNKQLTGQQVREFFQGLELDKEQLLKVLQYLQLQGISIEGLEPEQEESSQQEREKVPLTAEEEQYLQEYLEGLSHFEQEAGRETELFQALIQGREEAKQELTARYLPAAAHLAVEWNCEEIFLADLIQEANLGLLTGLERAVGYPDAGDAWLKGEILKGIQGAIEEQTQRKFQDDCLVAKVQNLETAIKELTEDEEEGESKFSIGELAIILDMDVEEIRDVLRLTGDDK